jgi:hypothetical protein
MGDASALETLEALGVGGILWQLARDGQLIEVRCEMPQGYCDRGRTHFDPAQPQADWSPTADHYPRLKAHGGHLTPDNVRLGHRLCNRRDYGWRMKINAMLRKRMTLDRRLAECQRRADEPRRRSVDPGLRTEGVRLLEKYRIPDSNRCYRRERAAS